MKKSKKFIVGVVLVIVGIIGLFGIFTSSDKISLLIGSLIIIVIGAILLVFDYNNSKKEIIDSTKHEKNIINIPTSPNNQIKINSSHTVEFQLNNQDTIQTNNSNNETATHTNINEIKIMPAKQEESCSKIEIVTKKENVKENININTMSENANLRYSVIKDYNRTGAFPNSFIVFDLETTGLNPENNQIIEIGAIKYIDGIEQERFHTYVNPEFHIPEEATRINGISDKTVKDAPNIHKAIKMFLDFINDSYLIAHNARFDMSFVQTQLNQLSFNLIDNKVIDTLSLSRQELNDLPNYKLITIKKYLNIEIGSHNALDDCYVTAQLYLYCRNKYEFKYGVKTQLNTVLTDNEQAWLKELIEIYKNLGIEESEMYVYHASGYLVINGGCRTTRIKLSKKMRYLLLHAPISKIKTELKCTEGCQSEGGAEATRVFIQHPEQIQYFKDFILH